VWTLVNATGDALRRARISESTNVVQTFSARRRAISVRRRYLIAGVRNCVTWVRLSARFRTRRQSAKGGRVVVPSYAQREPEFLAIGHATQHRGSGGGGTPNIRGPIGPGGPAIGTAKPAKSTPPPNDASRRGYSTGLPWHPWFFYVDRGGPCAKVQNSTALVFRSRERRMNTTRCTGALQQGLRGLGLVSLLLLVSAGTARSTNPGSLPPLLLIRPLSSRKRSATHTRTEEKPC
jgi:hypothetical protein